MDAGTPLGSGAGAEVVAWLQAVPIWHTALQVPQLTTGGQAGSAVSVGRMQLLGASSMGKDSCLSSALLGVWLEAGAQLGVRVPQLGKGPALSRAHPTTSPALYELVDLHGTQPAPIDPGRGAICSVVLWPCLPLPGLHGDVMFGSAPPVTA